MSTMACGQRIEPPLSAHLHTGWSKIARYLKWNPNHGWKPKRALEDSNNGMKSTPLSIRSAPLERILFQDSQHELHHVIMTHPHSCAQPAGQAALISHCLRAPSLPSSGCRQSNRIRSSGWPVSLSCRHDS